MSVVILFPTRDHVVVELLTVFDDDGSRTQRYFVSPFIDGAYYFGDFDSISRDEAIEAAHEWDLPVVDKTGWRQ